MRLYQQPPPQHYHPRQSVEDEAVEEEDTVASSRLMGMSGSYLEHLRTSHGSRNANNIANGHAHSHTHGVLNTTQEYYGDDDNTLPIFAKHLKASSKASNHGRSSKSSSNHSNRHSSHSQQSAKSSASTSNRHRSTTGSGRGSSSQQHHHLPPSANAPSANASAISLENSYTEAMNKVSQGGDYYYYDPQTQAAAENMKEPPRRTSRSNHSSNSARVSSQSYNSHTLSRKDSSASRTLSQRHSSSSGSGRPPSNRVSSTSELSIPAIPKKTVSERDPSEETIALFGAHGVTGHYFLQLAMEAGYQVRALVLPGISLDDVSPAADNLRLFTGAMDEPDKIRRVVKNASYVVCLLNDCDKTLLKHTQQQEDARTCSANLENMPPLMRTQSQDERDSIQKAVAASSNLQFMQTLVPILEEQNKCRVLLYQVSVCFGWDTVYALHVCSDMVRLTDDTSLFVSLQASSVARDDKGATPVLGKVAKKLAVKKSTRDSLREQDRIVKYIVNSTKQTSMNFIVTRPSSDTMIWDRPSRKKLAASKSVGTPECISNVF